MDSNQERFNRLGVMASCHFGIMTGIPLADNSNEVGNGHEDISAYDLQPEFTWANWVAAARQVGANLAIMTTRHVDGVANWPSNGVLGRTVVDTDWYASNPRDLVREFCNDVRGANMRVGMYYSVADAYVALSHATNSPEYLAYIKLQLTELLTNYGTIDFLILDAWGDSWDITFTTIPFHTLYDHVKSLQPNCLVSVNDHNNDFTRSGDVRTYEGPVDSEPQARKSGSPDKPLVLWKPIQYVEWSKWFHHSDFDPTDFAEPAARIMALSENRMMKRDYVIMHNFSPDYSGNLNTIIQGILQHRANINIPPIWDGLELHYRMDGTADEDSSYTFTRSNSTRHTLTAVGPPGSINGIKGLARTFSGSSQSFNNLLSGTPSNESPFGVENRTHSWAGWFYWDNSGGSFPAIFSKDDGSGVLTEYMLFIDTSNSKPTWRVSNDGNVLRNVVWSSGITANAWHHFVTTFNADTLAITIQIDGGTPVSAASLGITNTSVTKFNIGQRSDGSLPFKGRVDDLVLIKDRAVTQAEGAAMYNSGKGLSPLDPPASSVDTRSDLKLFYRMEGTLLEYDWSEWGHLGTGSFGQTLVPGKIGTARKFTSTSQDVHTAYDPVLGATPITVTTWVKLDDLTVNLQTYAIKALGSPDFTGWYLRKNNADNQLSATISISGAFTKALGPSDLTAGDWMMLGFTYDGAHLTAYKNGVAGTPVAVAGVIDNVNANITFGRDPAGTDRTVKGIVDDSKIFNRALSSTEMLVLYKQGFRRLTNGGLDLVGPSIILS